jgi:predicted phosphodiesterase
LAPGLSARAIRYYAGMKCLILADVHANLSAMQAVLAREKRWDEVVFLGDIVVGGPQPEQCAALLRELGGVMISGNHDRQGIEADIDPSDPNPDLQWVRWTQHQLSQASRNMIAAMPRTLAIEREGWTMRLHHGDFPGELGRFWPDWPLEKFDHLTRCWPEPCIIAAHSHVQFRRDHAGRVLLNPGSVGQPRLGQPLALYMILQDGHMHMKATPYDVESTCRAVAEMPLPPEFIAMWQGIYRNGMLSSRYALREWQPLIDAGYR